MSYPAPRLTVTVLCAALAAVSGCSTSRSPSSLRTLSAAFAVCTASNLTVEPDGAYTDPGTRAVGVWLRLRTQSGEPCVFKNRPSVTIDSGYGPSPAIDGTADPDPEVKPGLPVGVAGGLRLLVSWTSGCDPNHKAPIVKLMIGPEGDVHLAMSGSRLPAELDAFYCWNDGVELGTKGYT
jgi:hypothetical protein